MTDLDVGFVTEHVARVELRRPPNNYVDAGLLNSLADCYDSLAADGRCRAIVLCSAGKHFCAGFDFAAGASDGDASNTAIYAAGLRLFDARVPVVAAIQGAAIGGGLGLALTATFRVTDTSGRFAANFARLGVHQGFGLSVTLPDLVGQQHARDLLLSGRRVAGGEAVAMGLCDRLASDGDLLDEALRLADELAGSAPLAVRRILVTTNAGLTDRVRAAMERERVEQDALRETADAAEGIQAMVERRAPNFRGA
jgi:enoyl-CoA hydratase/carnithine racemase